MSCRTQHGRRSLAGLVAQLVWWCLLTCWQTAREGSIPPCSTSKVGTNKLTYKRPGQVPIGASPKKKFRRSRTLNLIFHAAFDHDQVWSNISVRAKPYRTKQDPDPDVPMKVQVIQLFLWTSDIATLSSSALAGLSDGLSLKKKLPCSSYRACSG